MNIKWNYSDVMKYYANDFKIRTPVVAYLSDRTDSVLFVVINISRDWEV
jgi:hypothetical protein